MEAQGLALLICVGLIPIFTIIGIILIKYRDKIQILKEKLKKKRKR